MKSTQLTKFYALGLVALSACRTTVIETPPDEAASAAISTVPADAPIRIVVPPTASDTMTHATVDEQKAPENKGVELVDKKLHPWMRKIRIDKQRVEDEVSELSKIYYALETIPDSQLKGKTEDERKAERSALGAPGFKSQLLVPYALTDSNYLMLDSDNVDSKKRVAETFMNETIMGSKEPARTMAYHRLAFMYAYYDLEGLDLTRSEATAFADRLLKEEAPAQYLVNHKAALMYAVYETEGLKRSIVEGRDFADKLASQKDADVVLQKHRDAFRDAQKDKGYGTSEALREANRVTHLD